MTLILVSSGFLRRLSLFLASVLAALALALPVRADLSGTWRAGATAIDVSIESWGEDCGPRPASTRSNGGGLVTVEQKGQALLLHGRDQDIRTDACWSRNPAMKRSAASYSDGLWMTRCRTAAEDPREELGIYTLTLQGQSTILYKDVSHYDWSLNESKCVATFTTTQTLTRAFVGKGDEPPVAVQPTAAIEPAPSEAKGCRPGPAFNISLRPKSAELEAGEKVCFKARVSDQTDCVLPNADVSFQLSHPKGTRGTLSAGCFTAAEAAPDAEGEFRVIAKSGRAQTEAVVVVKRMDLSSLIARRMESSGLSGFEETEEALDKSPKAVARIATHTTPVEQDSGRTVLLIVLGVLAVGLTAAGFWMIRRDPGRARSDDLDEDDEEEAQAPPAKATPAQSAKVNQAAAPAPSSQRPGETWICPTCRIGYPAERSTCPKDGTRLQPYSEFAQRIKREQQAKGKRCPTCGKNYPATAGFCGDDGASLVEQS
ncbi:MAG TPA: hypothetical protein VFN67_16010 [Polyangiales bacterium]|nr:hypothetical protein [Polyangiales bacterium]